MAEATAYESWVGTETSIGSDQLGSTWDQCQLGSVFLPGVVTIENFVYGQDIDIQKKRKKEKCRIRDNGLAPCEFDIKVELRASQWAEWLQKLPAIQPRREGGIRSPLKIGHPLPNAHGVRDIYVHKIKVDPPSARKGMVITIKVAEWFEEEKATKAATAARKNPLIAGRGYERPSYFGDPKKLADVLQSNGGFVNENSRDGVLGGGGITEEDVLERLFTDPDYNADPFVGVGA